MMIRHCALLETVAIHPIMTVLETKLQPELFQRKFLLPFTLPRIQRGHFVLPHRYRLVLPRHHTFVLPHHRELVLPPCHEETLRPLMMMRLHLPPLLVVFSK